MDISNLEARTNRPFALKNSIAISLLVLAFVFAEKHNLFDWRNLNPNGFTTLIFLFFLFACFFWWTKFFDRRPVISINENAITIKNRFWPFSRFQTILWTDMSYFYLLERIGPRRHVSSYLVLRQKESEHDIKVEITGLDKTVVNVLSVIRQYGKKYNFHDLGKEYS